MTERTMTMGVARLMLNIRRIKLKRMLPSQSDCDLLQTTRKEVRVDQHWFTTERKLGKWIVVNSRQHGTMRRTSPLVQSRIREATRACMANSAYRTSCSCKPRTGKRRAIAWKMILRLGCELPNLLNTLIKTDQSKSEARSKSGPKR